MKLKPRTAVRFLVALLRSARMTRNSPPRFYPFTGKILFMARLVQCIMLGKEAEGLDFPPYPGELGKRIWQGVSKQAWADWMKQQTMLVNENRLNLADARARQYLARQMEKHFFGDGADAVQGYVPPNP